jgi:hypothetical protein
VKVLSVVPIALLTLGTQAFPPATDAASKPASVSSFDRAARGETTRASQSHGRGRGKKARKSAPEYREVLLPANTPLSLELRSRLASDTSQIEDTVGARLRTGVLVQGETVLPAGTEVVGYVTDVERSGRVKGRARVALRFTVIRHNGDEYEVRTREIERLANSTKATDAATVGIGTGAGAAVGAILGGGSGAATGAAIGAAAGTGTVLATKGDDVRLELGERLETQLTAPLRVLINVR